MAATRSIAGAPRASSFWILSSDMIDPELAALLATLDDNDLGSLLILSDFLEERGDPRAGQLRRIYHSLYDDWHFAPGAYKHFQLTRRYIRPLFPEADQEENSK